MIPLKFMTHAIAAANIGMRRLPHDIKINSNIEEEKKKIFSIFIFY